MPNVTSVSSRVMVEVSKFWICWRFSRYEWFGVTHKKSQLSHLIELGHVWQQHDNLRQIKSLVKALNIFGRNILFPDFQIRQLKGDRFFWFFPKRPVETPPYLSQLEAFSKEKYVRFQFCIWTERSSGKRPLILASVNPQSFDWKWCQNDRKRHFFGCDTAGIEMRGTFLCWDGSSDAEL